MTDERCDYFGKVIGGQNITKRRPLFSFDCKLLLVPSVKTVRVYVVDSGQLLKCLRIDDLLEGEEIVCIQLHPINSFTQCICFTSKSRIVVFDYLEAVLIKQFFFNSNAIIFEREKPTDVRNLQITFAHIFDYAFRNSRKPDLILAYLLYDHNDCSLYFSRIEETETSFAESRMQTFILKANPTLDELAIAFGDNYKFVATIYDCDLRVYELNFKEKVKSKKHKIPQQFRCIACHPHERIIAAGDVGGRIFVYTNDFLDSMKPARSVIHWHALPVSDICFSVSGNYLYSVGSESTLVRWNLSEVGSKNLIPRLGYPLRFVVCDRKHENIAVSRADNSILVVGSHFSDPKQTIEGLSYGFSQNIALPSTGLLWDPKTESFVLNGRTGHLQFYSPYLEKQLFQLDVVGHNFLGPESNKIILNVEVIKAAITPNGDWLATVEMRDDHETLPEIRLKFWRSTNGPEKYILNTIIHLPHKNYINELKSSPNSKFFVTTSIDKEFKIWHFMKDENSKDGLKDWWACGKVGFLNSSTTPYAIGISSDSSVLAISFDSFITLWDISDEKLLIYKHDLTVVDDSHQRVVQKLDFASKDKSYLLLETKATVVRIWSLLSLSVLWRWTPPSPNFVDCSNLDPATNNVAVFLSNASVKIFSIESKTPLLSINLQKSKLDPNNKYIYFSLFIPRKSSVADKIFQCSHLCCMNIDQELMVILSKDESDVKDSSSENHLQLVGNAENFTPFAMMLFNKKDKELSSNINAEYDDLNKYFEGEVDSKKLVDEMFFKVPSHVLPPMEKMCSVFLKSLLNIRTEDDEEEEKSHDNDAVEKMAVVEEIEDVEMSKETKNSDEDETVASSFDFTEIKNFVLNENYHFLN
ncbi:WD repeat-containing protein 75-like isoform X1 [Dinothrombium tinctorium]|uniref:WD repeat-containing protein 75-like isoform X1 n=1 Tax=Dinothrombium tinctorium TaxID=1965070 RepID=A0A3S3Q5Y6_9ACAR|nr:WD repeat-containing protein 75-like isoform X1 [Dinothrombium tinctorium]